jgi:hypothetical protein
MKVYYPRDVQDKFDIGNMYLSVSVLLLFILFVLLIIRACSYQKGIYTIFIIIISVIFAITAYTALFYSKTFYHLSQKQQ